MLSIASFSSKQAYTEIEINSCIEVNKREVKSYT